MPHKLKEIQTLFQDYELYITYIPKAGPVLVNYVSARLHDYPNTSPFYMAEML